MFTTGILCLDEAQKMRSRNKLQESGTSLPCKKLLTNVDDEILHERFHVTHFEGCAVLFNKDTLYPDITGTIILLSTRKVSMSSCLCVLVTTLIPVWAPYPCLTDADQFLLAVAEQPLVVSPHQSTQLVLIVALPAEG